MTVFRIFALVLALVGPPVRAETTVIEALTDLNVNFDPVYSSNVSSPVLIDSLFDTLVAWDVEGDLLPAQADRWEISPDGLVYTFHLGSGNRWTDGAPVVAEDFVTAFRRFVDPATDDLTVLRYLLDPVVNAIDIAAGKRPPADLGVRALDEHTLEITLTSPTSYFTEILAQPALSAVPTHVLAQGEDGWTAPDRMVTNGPYRLESSEPGRVTMVRNPDFHIPPEPDRIELIFVDDTAELMRLLASNKVDIVLSLPQKAVAALRSGAWIKTIEVEASPATTYLSINTARPLLNDLRVRQALDLVIDRAALNQAQDEYAGVVATSFTSPTLFIHVPPPGQPDLPPYPERVEQARALLAEAGFNAGNPLQLMLMRRASSPQSSAAFVGIRAMLGQLPVEVTTLEPDRDELLRRLHIGEFDLAVLTWQGDYNDPMTFLALFRAGGFANFSAWVNPEYQRLLDEALRVTDKAAREEIYLRMEALIRTEIPVIPLRHSAISIVSSRHLLMPKLVNGIIYPRLVRFRDG
ncbi:MAG: peptide ABC transporter substrate-binding protein [Rhodobacteraceae bacterium]|nr:peptide ABC transporter substrate-binding protein [Paracoccaceae bacterium]